MDTRANEQSILGQMLEEFEQQTKAMLDYKPKSKINMHESRYK